MNYSVGNGSRFYLNMSDFQLNTKELFGTPLMDSLKNNFGIEDIVFLIFDDQHNFHSWILPDGVTMGGSDHPYTKYARKDSVSNYAFHEGVRLKLDYYNTEPLVYKSTDVIGSIDYENSSYAAFLQDNFGTYYSATMPFGINAYIQIVIMKKREEGDFTAEEIDCLKNIYVLMANIYVTFKKHEMLKMVGKIHQQIIATGEKAYIITDNYYHLFDCNDKAREYMIDILGIDVADLVGTRKECLWIPFLLSDAEGLNDPNEITEKTIRGYKVKIKNHYQTYTHGIVDKYYWITISKPEDTKKAVSMEATPLTPTEKKVAQLLLKGLTYQSIANEMVISYHTVKKHVQNIYTKCDVKNRHQLSEYLKNFN